MLPAILIVLIGVVCSEVPLNDKVRLKPLETVHFPDSPRIARQASDSCDITVNEEEGWIFSPNYPSNYGNQESCSFVVQRWRRDVCQVQLSLMDFDLDDTNGCFGDYLDISDGSPQVPGGGKLCGSLASGTKKTLTFPRGRDSLVLRFRSDARSTRKGFMIKVNQLPDSCDRRPDPFDNEAHCDRQVTGYDAVLRSPGYPNWYPRETRCRYTLKRPDSGVCRVELNFFRFEVEFSPGCRNDFLELPGGNRLCGNVVSPSVLEYPPVSNTMQILFSSDLRGTAPGFEIAVRQIPNSCGRNPPRPTDDLCDQELSGYEARATSPGFPSEYGPNKRCSFFLRRADPTVCLVDVDFYFFDLERGRDGLCQQDYLEMPDGNKLCGIISGQRQYKFPSGSGTFKMTFNSDHSGLGKGFDVRLRQRPNSCDNHSPPGNCDVLVTSETQIIRSPGYPSNYPNGERCLYTVQRMSPDTCQVRMDFLDLDLDGGSSLCNQDYIEVEHTGERICGSNVRNVKIIPFPANTDTILFVFKTDSVRSGRGFEIRLTQVRSSCFRGAVDPEERLPICGTVREYTGLIQSGNYPLAYAPEQDCLYRVQRASSDVCRIEFFLDHFDVGTGSDSLCLGDYLEIASARYCGRRDRQTVRVDFPPEQSELNARFRTDAYDQHPGFRIEVRQQTTGCSDVTPVNRNCGATYSDGVFDLISPGFRNGTYPVNEDCRYLIRKIHNDVCALEVKYNVFDLEQSQNCDRDFLEISDQKVCGKLPFDTTRTYEFPEDTMTIRFRSDNRITGAGFFITIKQVQC